MNGDGLVLMAGGVSAVFASFRDEKGCLESQFTAVYWSSSSILVMLAIVLQDPFSSSLS
jgi:hypothetical protein